MWKTWRWKASRRSASHPLTTSLWTPKRTPPTQASVCRLENVSAPGCLKSAFVEKVRDCPVSPPLLPESLTQLPSSPSLFLPPKKMSFQPAATSPAWYLTCPLFEPDFYSIHGSMINCAVCVCRPLKYFMVVIEWSVISPDKVWHMSTDRVWYQPRYATVTTVCIIYFLWFCSTIQS